MSSVGLDIGLSGIRVCVLGGTPRAPKIETYIDHRLEAQEGPFDYESLAEIINVIFRSNKISQANVVVAIPAKSAIIRELQVPFTSEDEIRKTIKFQVESFLHSVSIDDVVVDFHRFQEDEESSRLITFSVKKDQLSPYLNLLGQAGIDPMVVDVDVSALFNAFTRHPLYSENETKLLVELGTGSLKVIVIEDGQLRFGRSVRMRLDDKRTSNKSSPKDFGNVPEQRPKTAPMIDGKFVEEAGNLEESHFGIEHLDGDLFKPATASDKTGESDYGEIPSARLPLVILDDDESEILDLLDERIPEELRTSALEKALREISRTLGAIRLKHSLSEILLTGRGSSLPEVEEVFERHFGLPALRLDINDCIEGQLGTVEEKDSFGQLGGVALGLSLKGLGIDAGGMDFRQEDFAFAGRFERIKGALACTVVLLFVMFFLTAYHFHIEDARQKNVLNAIRLNMSYAFNKVFAGMGEELPRNPKRSIYNAFQRVELKIKNELGESEGIPEIVNSLDMINEVCRAVKRARVPGLKIKTINVNGVLPGKGREASPRIVEFIGPSGGALNIKRLLNQSNIIEAMEPSQSRNNDGTYLITLPVRPKRKVNDGT